MSYKIDNKKKKLNPKYFEDKEVQLLVKRSKGKFPAYTDISRSGFRKGFSVQERVYKKGNFVQYQEGIARVEKVTKKGIYLRKFKKDKTSGLSIPDKKTKFVSVKDVEAGKVYPFSANFPFFP